MLMNTLEKINRKGLKKQVPDFSTGDTVKIHTRIKEGDKDRIQIFEGVVIRRKGSGMAASLTVRKVSYGVGVERIFPLHSPNVAKIEVAQRGKSRRSKLYYLRHLSGKKARLDVEEGSWVKEGEATQEETPSAAPPSQKETPQQELSPAL